MPFEVFNEKVMATAGQAYVSIQKGGVIRMNRAAYALIGEPEQVELLFDAERQLVGLRPAKAGVPHAYVVRKHARGSSFLVSGARFASHYGIPIDAGRRWLASLDGDILCFNVGEDPVP
jgi:hypothetical protein